MYRFSLSKAAAYNGEEKVAECFKMAVANVYPVDILPF